MDIHHQNLLERTLAAPSFAPSRAKRCCTSVLVPWPSAFLTVLASIGPGTHISSMNSEKIPASLKDEQVYHGLPGKRRRARRVCGGCPYSAQQRESSTTYEHGANGVRKPLIVNVQFVMRETEEYSHSGNHDLKLLKCTFVSLESSSASSSNGNDSLPALVTPPPCSPPSAPTRTLSA
ncbi:hypothetical protein D9619_003972 [Psilocybe cf. subviscida]|uniref:Uncharacterized protein n=1 Tax=Psilocybe cf. subviscida TaxID=2480587 RepID=A0A8H5BPR3_9AGAR|nr:hypothetical protein D9619_003972 [Psilocybe cf. subviscida]